MKFSTFAGVATIFSGAALAVPHTKRADISSILTPIQNEVTGVLAEVETIAGLLDDAVASDITTVSSIAAELLNVNGTLTNIVSLLQGLDQIDKDILNTLTSGAELVIGAHRSLVGGVVSVIAGLLDDLTGLASAAAANTLPVRTVTPTLTGYIPIATSTVTIPTLTSIALPTPTGLSGITDVTALASILAELVGAVGTILESVLSALADDLLSDLTAANNEAVSQVEQLATAINSLLTNILSF